MSTSLNRVTVSGNLCRDPELRALPSGTSVCELRIAVNERVRNSATGEWGERANYFNVTVWGAQGENVARYLTKGRGVAIDGRLRWREFEVDGVKRQAVDITADSVVFLGSANGNGAQSAGAGDVDVPVAAGDFGPAHTDDDIPF